MTDRQVLLSARGLTKRFGGLAAVNDVSLDLWLGHIHAVIGPNGAGKSTLANLLSGDLPPTSGSITLGEHPISGWTPEKISRHGLGRSYQKTNIFSTFSVWDNVRLAAQSRVQPSPFNPLGWLQAAARMQAVNQRAERAMELAELQDRRHAQA
ncbi:MAG: ATP-binding cassette domain-containing protein, partial [Limnohabitans sp.]|nr:ATP-binding cassette domain-containing protein [Limnohabitans sp.]